MELNVGYRVTSSEVELLWNEGTSQERILEIVDFLENGKVRCIHFSEKIVNPLRTEYDVSRESIKYVSDEPLKYRGIEKDKFFDRHTKKL